MRRRRRRLTTSGTVDKKVLNDFLQVVGRDGWMHTGDTAVITEAGYGKIVGRMKDMVIRGGENIYPRLDNDWNIICIFMIYQRD